MRSGDPLFDSAVRVEHGVAAGAQAGPRKQLVGPGAWAVRSALVDPADAGATGRQRVQPRTEDDECFVGEEADLHLDAGFPKAGGSTLAPRSRIDYRDQDSRDAGVEEGLVAWGSAAVVVAGLQGDDGSPAGGPRPGGGQCVDLGVGLALAPVVSLSDRRPVPVEDHAAHGRVGARRTEAQRGDRDGPLHRGDLGLAGAHAAAPSSSSSSATGARRRCRASCRPSFATACSVRIEPELRAIASASRPLSAAAST